MTTKFEVGKEYVLPREGWRMRVTAVNDWGALFEHVEGDRKGEHASCGHADDHDWRPAPRTVERWIAIDRLAHTITTTKKEDAEAWAKERSGVVSGPFKIEVPW